MSKLFLSYRPPPRLPRDSDHGGSDTKTFGLHDADTTLPSRRSLSLNSDSGLLWRARTIPVAREAKIGVRKGATKDSLAGFHVPELSTGSVITVTRRHSIRDTR